MSAPVFLKLLHGRTDPDQPMEDWGFTGPTLGPFEAVHFTYATHVRCFPQGSDGDSEAVELRFHDDLLVHDGKYYGDFEIAASSGDSRGTDLLAAAQVALNYLTDHAIDLDGEPEELVAGLRIELADAIARAQGGAP